MAYISKIKPNGAQGTEYDLKDATARSAIENTNRNIQSSITPAKAAVVTAPDAAPINAEDITVDITPVQDLHGYDRPWAGGAGKNKLPLVLADIKSLNTAGTWSENVYTYRNVSYSILTDNENNITGLGISGTNTERSDLFLPPPLLSGLSNIAFSARFISGSPVRALRFQMYGGTGTARDRYINADPTETTWNVDGEYTAAVLSVYGGSGDIAITLQIEEGSTVTSFAPYSNICPIEGWTGAELDRVGKNWLNYDDNTSGYNNQRCSSSIINNEIIITATGPDCYIGLLNREYSDAYFAISPCKEGDVLKLVVSNNLFSKNYATFFNKNNEIVGTLDIYLNNFTVPKGAVKMGFRLGYELSVSGTTYKLKAMIVKATETDLTYEPYQGQQYTASFGETVYGGKWHVTAGGTDKTHGNIASYNGETINEPWLSSMDEYSPGATPTIGAQVVYPLTTPTTISTPKQNVPMLQGINTVYADCGDTQLKYQPDNVIGELKGMIAITAGDGTTAIAKPKKAPTSWSKCHEISVSNGRCAYGNGTFVCAYTEQVRRDPYARVLYSKDGVTWKNGSGISTSVGYGLSSIAYGNGIFIAVGSYSLGADYIVESKDNGQTWQPISLPSGVTHVTNIQYIVGKFYLIESASPYGIWNSVDGNEWTKVSDAGIALEVIAYGQGLMCGISGDSSIYVSDDMGVTWTDKTIPTTDSSSEVLDIIYVDDVEYRGFYAVGVDSAQGGGLWYSEDGDTWAKTNIATETTQGTTTKGLRTIGYGNKMLVMAGNGDQTYYKIGNNSPVALTPVATDDYSRNIVYGAGMILHATSSGIYNLDGITEEVSISELSYTFNRLIDMLNIQSAEEVSF